MLAQTTPATEPAKPLPRIPLEHAGIQVNFCKNPECANYGIPAAVDGKFAKRANADRYVVVSSGSHTPQLRCKACGEHLPVKSNVGVAEEIARLQAVVAPTRAPTCPDPACANHTVPVTTPKAYQSFGLTKSGSRRYRCKACQKTFAVGTATRYQKQPAKTAEIFKLLMNKSPLRRICEVAEIHPETLYHRLGFLATQCNAFTGHHEAQLATMPITRLYLATDRQDYAINWAVRKDKRNTVFQGVATADNVTRYVFGHHLNYDETLDAETVSHNAEVLHHDYAKPYPFRRYARVWLPADYEQNRVPRAPINGAASLAGEIAATYTTTSNRANVEQGEVLTSTMQLPQQGMQVHAEYTLYGHFHYLRRLLGNVEKVRFFLDQDSGMRAACLAGFQEAIAARTADAFYVRISKDLTVDEKRRAKRESQQEFAKFAETLPGATEDYIKCQMIKAEIARMREIGQWKDKWLVHPLPDMSEPEKMVCYLTDYQDYPEDHLAHLYQKASLHGVDTYFMLARRRVAMMERPIHSSSNAGRVWNGYGAYNPLTLVKILAIFRTFYNYILVGQDKQTPAMRLGLADRPYTYQEVIDWAG